MAGVAVGGSGYYNIGSGTSYAAPQVAGAIALLNEAFPNHTPEMIVDRLLATGQNSTSLIGAHTGAVTFGNSIQHGYNANYGHGLMDVYAALNPITSSSYTQSNNQLGEELGGGEGNGNGQSFGLITKVLDENGQIERHDSRLSYIATGQSIGDALQNNLSEVQNYVYDALDGGFKYKLSAHVLDKVTKKPIAKLDIDFNLLDKNLVEVNEKKFEFIDQKSGVVFEKTHDTNHFGFNTTLFEPSIAVQNFIKDDNDFILGFDSTDALYLDTKENGYSIGYRERVGENLSLNYGFEAPMRINDDDFEGKNTMFVMSAEYKKDNYKHSIITGQTTEMGSFLDTEAKGIFEMNNLQTEHNFFGFKSELKLGKSLYFKTNYNSAISNLNYSYSPIIESSTELVSDNFDLAIAKDFESIDLKTVLFISQPNRISSGTLTFNQPSLSDLNGDIYYDKKNVSLKPSGRQIDYGIGFAKDIGEDSKLITKFIFQDEYNHNKNSDSAFGFTILGKYKNFKLGYGYESFDYGNKIKMNYKNFTLDFDYKGNFENSNVAFSYGIQF